MTVLTARTNAQLHDGASPSAAFVDGLQWACAAALIAMAVVAVVLTLPSRADSHEPAEAFDKPAA